MDLEQLRQLVAVDEAGTMSGAAQRAHVTQPSLSRSMQRLEAKLGCELFDRTADLAIMRKPIALPNCECIPLMAENLSVSVPAAHPLATRTHVSFADLADETFLVLDGIGFWKDVYEKGTPTCVPSCRGTARCSPSSSTTPTYSASRPTHRRTATMREGASRCPYPTPTPMLPSTSSR